MSTLQTNPTEWVEKALESMEGALPANINRPELEEALWQLEEEGTGELTADETDIINQVLVYQSGSEHHQSLPTEAEQPEPQAKPQDVGPGEETGEIEDVSNGLLEAPTDQTDIAPGGDSTPSPDKPKEHPTKTPDKPEAKAEETKADEDQEEGPKKEKWHEGPSDWGLWSIEKPGEPKPRDVLDEISLTLGSNKLDPKAKAERVWHREVARTYSHKGEYWYLNDSGRWGVYTKEDLITILEGTELFHGRPVDSKDAATWRREKSKAFIRRILTKNQVDFVGELAGHKAGVVDWKGEKYLIRKGPEIIAPTPGDFSTIEGLLHDLLGPEQLPYLYGWPKTSYEALRDGEKSTGHTLVFSGPGGIGKSFAKEFIIRPILGDRHTDPTNYLQGKTNFNADTSRAESWEVDDSVGTADSNKRKMLTG